MEKKILSVVVSVLIGVLGWTWTTTFSKLVEIEKELKNVQLELTKMQVLMITEERVKEIVGDELLKRGIK